MRDLLKRLDRLEEASHAADAGKVILVSWHSPSDQAEARIARGSAGVMEREEGEAEAAFIARISAAWKPATGVVVGFLERR